MRLHRSANEPNGVVLCDHESLGHFEFRVDVGPNDERPSWLFTENETNPNRHPGTPTSGSFFKDAFHANVVNGDSNRTDSREFGTKCAAHYIAIVQPDKPLVIRCRLTGLSPETIEAGVSPTEDITKPIMTPIFADHQFGDTFETIFKNRRKEADAFDRGKIDLATSVRRLALDETVLLLRREFLDQRRPE
jgi:hypothetical protein